MTRTNYKIVFMKKPEDREKDEQDRYLGCVYLDDTGVDRFNTLTAKAFRHCPEGYLIADRVIVEKVDD